MDKNSEKEKLNDELLNNVAGGDIVVHSYQDEPERFVYVCNSLRCCGSDFISDYLISVCPYCGSAEICLVDAYTGD